MPLGFLNPRHQQLLKNTALSIELNQWDPGHDGNEEENDLGSNGDERGSTAPSPSGSGRDQKVGSDNASNNAGDDEEDVSSPPLTLTVHSYSSTGQEIQHETVRELSPSPDSKSVDSSRRTSMNFADVVSEVLKWKVMKTRVKDGADTQHIINAVMQLKPYHTATNRRLSPKGSSNSAGRHKKAKKRLRASKWATARAALKSTSGGFDRVPNSWLEEAKGRKAESETEKGSASPRLNSPHLSSPRKGSAHSSQRNSPSSPRRNSPRLSDAPAPALRHSPKASVKKRVSIVENKPKDQDRWLALTGAQKKQIRGLERTEHEVIDGANDSGTSVRDEDVLEYAETILHIDVVRERELIQVARRALFSPLPPDWGVCLKFGGLYYVNLRDGRCSFQDPGDEYYLRQTAFERRRLLTQHLRANIASHDGVVEVADLSGRNLDDDAVSCIGPICGPHVRYLNLAYNRFTDIGLERVCQTLSMSVCLVSLDISDNPYISSMSADILSMLLLSTNSLQHLRVSNCGWGEFEAQRLCEGLRGNSSLTALDLSSNRIGLAGVGALRTVLDSCALKSLNLSGNEVAETALGPMGVPYDHMAFEAFERRFQNLSIHDHDDHFDSAPMDPSSPPVEMDADDEALVDGDIDADVEAGQADAVMSESDRKVKRGSKSKRPAPILVNSTAAEPPSNALRHPALSIDVSAPSSGLVPNADSPIVKIDHLQAHHLWYGLQEVSTPLPQDNPYDVISKPFIKKDKSLKKKEQRLKRLVGSSRHLDAHNEEEDQSILNSLSAGRISEGKESAGRGSEGKESPMEEMPSLTTQISIEPPTTPSPQKGPTLAQAEIVARHIKKPKFKRITTPDDPKRASLGVDSPLDRSLSLSPSSLSVYSNSSMYSGGSGSEAPSPSGSADTRRKLRKQRQKRYREKLQHYRKQSSVCIILFCAF